MVVSLPNQMPNGVYTVAWRTLSAVDGHTVDGAYPIIIGPMPAEGVPVTAASSQATFDPETAVGRWWFSLTASAVFGILLSWNVVFRPLFGRSNPAAMPLAAERARKLAVASGLLLLVGTLFGAVAQASDAANVPIWGVFGQPLVDLLIAWSLRHAVLDPARAGCCRLRVVGVARRTTLARSGGDGGRGAGAAHQQLQQPRGGAALGLVSRNRRRLAALSGRRGVAGRPDEPRVRAADRRPWQPIDGRPGARSARSGRFSNLALIAVLVIIATGIFQAWLEVGSWDGFVQTAFGLSVPAKVGLLLLMLLLAGVQFARRAAWTGAHRRPAAVSGGGLGLARRFSSAVRIEVALGIAVLVVAAILTGLVARA